MPTPGTSPRRRRIPTSARRTVPRAHASAWPSQYPLDRRQHVAARHGLRHADARLQVWRRNVAGRAGAAAAGATPSRRGNSSARAAAAAFQRARASCACGRPDERGYLRRNGVPYSENATLDEYFDTFTEPNGDTWLVVTSIVSDPKYLTGPYTSTVPFKKIPDRQGWDPTPCKADEAR